MFKYVVFFLAFLLSEGSHALSNKAPFVKTNTSTSKNVAESPKAQEKIYPSNDIILEEVEFDGKPDEVYYINKKIIALDAWVDGVQVGLRMKINGKEQVLRFNRPKDTYENSSFIMTLKTIDTGKCGKDSEGVREARGEMQLQSTDKKTSKKFTYSQTFYGCP